MQKIMFNDKFGLTQAVLDGFKTQTRRVVPNCSGVRQSPFVVSGVEEILGRELKPKYEVGEVVAIAQCYAAMGWGDNIPVTGIDENGMPIFASEAGVFNKMFVRADLCKHHIRITGVRVQRLQDISDEDCIKEGIRRWTKDGELYKYDLGDGFELYEWSKKPKTPREVYARLIDKISGKGTWESNPFVFVYDFELEN